MTPTREITDDAYRETEREMLVVNHRSMKELLKVYAALVDQASRADWHWMIASFKRRYEKEHEKLPYNPNYVVSLLDVYKKDVFDSGVPISILVIGHDLPDLAEIIAAEPDITPARMRAYAFAFRESVGPYGDGTPTIEEIEKELARPKQSKRGPDVGNLPSLMTMVSTLNAYKGYLGMAEYQEFFASSAEAQKAVKHLERAIDCMMQGDEDEEVA